MGESKDIQIRQDIADEGYEPDPLTIPPYYGVETQVVDGKLKILKPSDREPKITIEIPKSEDSKYDPDHLNPSKGGNRASDDYW